MCIDVRKMGTEGQVGNAFLIVTFVRIYKIIAVMLKKAGKTIQPLEAAIDAQHAEAPVQDQPVLEEPNREQVQSANGVKLVKTAAGKMILTFTKTEWQAIGKKAGWLRKQSLSDRLECDQKLNRALQSEIQKAEQLYMQFAGDYGSDSEQVQEAAQRAVYYQGWWIMFQNGRDDIWFTPFEDFKRIDPKNYQNWCEGQKEAIWNKIHSWKANKPSPVKPSVTPMGQDLRNPSPVKSLLPNQPS